MQANGRSALDDLIDGLEAHGDRALVQSWTADAPEQLTYRGAAERVQALARGLRRRIERGEAVVLIGASSAQWIIAALAIVRAGAVVTPLDVQLADETLRRVLEDSGARRAFTTRAQQERVRRAGAQIEIVLLDGDAEQDQDWRTLTADDSALPDNAADDHAALFYTSGTTGPPKGVPLTHRNLAFQVDILRDIGVVHSGDRVLLPLPLHHVYPFVIGMLAPVALGLTLILPHALTGPQVIRALRDGEATVVVGVPRLYGAVFQGIVAQGERGPWPLPRLFHGALWLSRTVRRRLGVRLGKWLLRPVHRRVGPQLRVLASGGSALDAELAWNLEALGWQVVGGYGLTETAPLLTIEPPEGTRPGTAGRAVRGVELRIDREAGTPGEATHEGEILARGPNVFAGYRNQPEKTREVLTDDGWFRTGDLGWLDDDGYLHIAGRKSTLIVTEGGENIRPDDVEARYTAHEAIREVGVLQQEGRLAALVVPERSDADSPEDHIRDAIREVAGRLPSYQRLEDFALTRKPLPRTRLGKIRRHELAERYDQARASGGEETEAAPLDPREMSADDRSLLEQPAAASAWNWLAERYPKQGLTPDTSVQLDLGVDSLGWLDLTLAIGERTGVELGDEAIGRIETVRDLLRELVDAAGDAEKTADPLEDPERALDTTRRRWLRPRGALLRLVASALYAVNWGLLHGLFRLRVKGRPRVPRQGPLVVACSHASYLDPFAVAAALPLGRLHSLYWGGWTGAAFSNPLQRFVSRAAQVIPIDPRAGVRSSLALAAAVLERKRGLIWFPEGRRSQDGELQSLRPGIGMLLERFPVPVVPVSIHGAHEAMPPGRRIPRLRRIRVRFGEPLDPRQLAEQGQGDKAATRIVDALERRMRELHAQS